VLTTAPLALRRIRPLTAFWVMLLGTVLTTQYSNLVTFIAVMVAAYSAVVHSRYRSAALVSVPLAGVFVTAAFPDTTPPLPGRFTALLVLIPVAMVGNATRLWRRRAGDSQARLQSVQAEHEAATLRALVAERARIAAEMHDVVTHNVSVMVVQAGAARRVMTASPGEAMGALLAVEASGRAAMIELQHLLGLLAPADGMSPEESGLLRPQPGLDQLRALLDRLAAAGLSVDLTIVGEPGPLQPGVDLTAFRVVQEALTNVLKHAGQARTAVRLEYRAQELVIDVADDGPRLGGVARGRVFAAAGTAGGGRGLLGLRERVSLYGGEFGAGPRPAGGWRVTARLPHDQQGADDAACDPGAHGILAALPART
jgi:signal transduction histidine kinase